MPDEPIETPTEEIETPPAAPPVEAPPVVDEEPAPVFSWDFPTPVEQPPARTQEEEDEYASRVQQGAVMTSIQMTTAMQKNLATLKSNLHRNNATEEVIARAEEEFWKFGVGAANPDAVQFATKLALGSVAMEGKPITKPKATVRAPGAPPVGNLPQPVGKHSDSKNLAMEAFNKELQALGLPLMTEDDFAEVE